MLKLISGVKKAPEENVSKMEVPNPFSNIRKIIGGAICQQFNS